MGRRSKGKRKPGSPRAQARTKPAAPAANSNVTPNQALHRIEIEARREATEADLEAAKATPIPGPEASPESTIKRAAEALALLDAQRKRVAACAEKLQSKEASIDQRLQALDEDRKAIDTRQTEFDARDVAFTQRERQVGESEADLLTREEQLVHRELDADAGFLRRNKEALARLEAEGEEIRMRSLRHRKEIDEERRMFEEETRAKRVDLAKEIESRRKAVEAECVAAREALDIELAKERAHLDHERAEVHVETKRLRQQARNLDVDRELLDEDRKAFDEKVAIRAARDLEFKNSEIQALTERLDAARTERGRLSERLEEREEADRQFGGEPPEAVMRRIRTAEKERDQLRAALGERPSAEAAQRLEALEREKELWESDRLRLTAEVGEARQELTRKLIAVTEMESLRDHKRSLESANALLHETNRQLRQEVETLVKGVEGKSPFPSCTAMDSDRDLQTPRETDDKVLDLVKFSHYVRHRMARDPETGKELYYSEEDVRSFLGGLAMSRLHLLQGISGTGKTSLPLAFAKAVGADSAVVEVQAGWRDRQDLVGHFNTFERRFHESEFLQAMYRTKCPANHDRPFIIVLDEMNLSHPEQYFADLLSALEQDQHRQRLVLMTAAVDPAPKLLADGGTKLMVPSNVWFVGTANHDETTRDFAPKTYDRAHVMELPRTREKFAPESFQPGNPISLHALENAFQSAVDAHQADAARAYAFLQDHFGDTLDRRFRVGWGNRLERQMNRYLPVVVAAGGNVGEATDHILATKLLRKIRDRHENRPEDIVALRDLIRTTWPQIDKETQPARSLELLTNELHRLRQDDD